MTIVITRDVEARYRGFLGSIMLEVSPGVYAHPRLSSGVRGRMWSVLDQWHGQLHRGSIVMIWAETAANGGIGLRQLGEPARDIVLHDSLYLIRRALRATQAKS